LSVGCRSRRLRPPPGSISAFDPNGAHHVASGLDDVVWRPHKPAVVGVAPARSPGCAPAVDEALMAAFPVQVAAKHEG
jgi:hypothetical protein